MAKNKANRPKARLPRGFADRSPAEIRRVHAMTEAVRDVYERWGFEPVETPLIEYADALGKFLPDADRPNEGVFAFQDDDEQWLSLRYDLTAPLARMVAANFDRLPRPYKSYRAGWVFRNEKPGPGRFRQFMQFDADIVGAASPLADAEICLMAADTMQALGFARGEYVIRVNSRKVLDGVLSDIGLPEGDPARLTVLRAIDKADKFPLAEVAKLLGKGREDESGDFTRGAGLSDDQAAQVLALIDPTAEPHLTDDLKAIGEAVAGADGAIRIDPSVVRGLEYYTGAVFEAELTMDVIDDDGRPVRFGSVGGGGRYDGLVGRFVSQDVPATGFSIGVSRLAAAIAARDQREAMNDGPVIVTVMDREAIGDYQRLTAALRAALNTGGQAVPVELYVGDAGMKAQLKYADRRSSPCVIIQGSDERAAGKVQIKDLAAGKLAAENFERREDWVAERAAQVEVNADVAAIAAKVREILAS